jgi:hypothetical protein
MSIAFNPEAAMAASVEHSLQLGAGMLAPKSAGRGSTFCNGRKGLGMYSYVGSKTITPAATTTKIVLTSNPQIACRNGQMSTFVHEFNSAGSCTSMTEVKAGPDLADVFSLTAVASSILTVKNNGSADNITGRMTAGILEEINDKQMANLTSSDLMELVEDKEDQVYQMDCSEGGITTATMCKVTDDILQRHDQPGCIDPVSKASIRADGHNMRYMNYTLQGDRETGSGTVSAANVDDDITKGFNFTAGTTAAPPTSWDTQDATISGFSVPNACHTVTLSGTVAFNVNRATGGDSGYRVERAHVFALFYDAAGVAMSVNSAVATADLGIMVSSRTSLASSDRFGLMQVGADDGFEDHNKGINYDMTIGGTYNCPRPIHRVELKSTGLCFNEADGALSTVITPQGGNINCGFGVRDVHIPFNKTQVIIVDGVSSTQPFSIGMETLLVAKVDSSNNSVAATGDDDRIVDQGYMNDFTELMLSTTPEAISTSGWETYVQYFRGGGGDALHPGSNVPLSAPQAMSYPLAMSFKHMFHKAKHAFHKAKHILHKAKGYAKKVKHVVDHNSFIKKMGNALIDSIPEGRNMYNAAKEGVKLIHTGEELYGKARDQYRHVEHTADQARGLYEQGKGIYRSEMGNVM